MIGAIACFSCGKRVSGSFSKFQKLIEEKVESDDALDQLKITRYCCRGLFLAQIELIDEIIDLETDYYESDIDCHSQFETETRETSEIQETQETQETQENVEPDLVEV